MSKNAGAWGVNDNGRAGGGGSYLLTTSGGGGSGGGALEARVAVLESNVTRLRDDVKGLSSSVDAARETLGRIEGRLDGLAKAADVTSLAATLTERPSRWEAFRIALLAGALTAAAGTAATLTAGNMGWLRALPRP